MTAMPDPPRVVWQALEAAGCDPHGSEHDFRARCPGHQGQNSNALHVSEGGDRRAVLYCFRGCDAKTVVAALGLQWRDLFPAGHRQHRRRARSRPGPRGRLEVILDGLAFADIPVRGLWVADRCPYCDAPGLWIKGSRAGAVDVACADGCVREDIFGALEAVVAIREAEHGAR